MNYITDLPGGEEVQRYFPSCFIQVQTPLFGPLLRHLSYKLPNSSKACLLTILHYKRQYKRSKGVIFAKTGTIFFLFNWKEEKIKVGAECEDFSVCFFSSHLTYLFEKVAPQSVSYRLNSIPYNNAELHRYPKPKETYSLSATTNDGEQVCHAMGTDGSIITQLRIYMVGAETSVLLLVQSDLQSPGLWAKPEKLQLSGHIQEGRYHGS